MRSVVLSFILLSLCLVILAGTISPHGDMSNAATAIFKGVKIPNGSNFKCTICVVVLTIVHNEVQDERDAIEKFLSKVCTYVPEEYREMAIIDLLMKKEEPSKICNQIPAFECNGCSLNITDASSAALRSENDLIRYKRDRQMKAFLLSAWMINSRRYPLKSPSNQDDELPIVDDDKDYFAPERGLYRGADWRGRDCNDQDATVRPGLAADSRQDVDSNCNGISGVDEEHRSYEIQFCNGTGSQSVLMFGDSASSAFHIPPEWLHLQNISELLGTLNDEFDWPQYSYGTGFDESIHGESIYLRLRERNLCNHRDYQNVGHNGARIQHMAQTQIPQLAKLHKPVMALAGYIGNDVCKDRLDHMTKPEDFKRDLISGIQALDSITLKGSKLLYMGLVDGRILWNEMSNRIHPLGATYANVYEFLSCTSANPCATWLTSDEATRNATSERAALLSQTAKSTIGEMKSKVKNLEIDYIDFPLAQAIQYCKTKGISPSLLIEAFDGFHPSHFGHRIFSQFIWQFLEQNHPDWLGTINPHNDMIKKIFADQGGF